MHCNRHAPSWLRDHSPSNSTDWLEDIADYVGLTIETVSRTLTRLEKPGCYWRARSASNHIW